MILEENFLRETMDVQFVTGCWEVNLIIGIDCLKRLQQKFHIIHKSPLVVSIKQSLDTLKRQRRLNFQNLSKRLRLHIDISSARKSKQNNG